MTTRALPRPLLAALSVALLSIASRPAGAQPVAAGGEAGKPDVRAKLVAPAAVAPGTKAVVAVEMTLGPKWHVNAHVPSESFLVPTEVTLKAEPGSLSAVRYPADVSRRFAFSAKPMKVYEGTVRFEAELAVPAKAAGNVVLSGTLSYQACNDTQCFAPAKLPLTATVPVQPPGRR